MSRCALIVGTLLLSLGGAAADAQPLPVLAQARRLACAREPGEAREAVRALRSADALALGFPDEQLSSGERRFLRASVLDILLAALALGVRRNPELEPEVRALVRSWNPCAVLDAGEVYDVTREQGAPRRQRLVMPLPLGGAGLRAWRLLPEHEADAASAPGSSPASPDMAVFEQLCGQEAEGASLFDFAPAVPSGPMSVAPPAPEVEPSCLAPPAPPPAVPAMPSAPPEPLVAEVPRELPLPILVPTAILPPPGTQLGAVPLIAGRGSYSLSVGVSFAQALEGEGSLGAVGLFTPVKGFTVRVGLSDGLLREFQPVQRLQRPMLSWGVGLDGGKPGTWSLHLDNWGPVDPLAPRKLLDGAVFDVSYQVRLPESLPRALSTSMKLTVPIRGAPSSSTVLTLGPVQGAFAVVALRFSPLERTALTWSYSAGYALSQGSRTFSLAFTHWGATPAFQFEPLKGGALNAGVSWSL